MMMSELNNSETDQIISGSLDLIPKRTDALPCRLVCGPRLVIGRNRSECDLVTSFLPRNGENDQLTLKLSQIHAIAEREGENIRLRDADSAAGTFWNGERIRPGDGEVICKDSQGGISLGRNYRLELKFLEGGILFQPRTSTWHIRSCIWFWGPVLNVGLVKSKNEGLLEVLLPVKDSAECAGQIISNKGGLEWKSSGSASAETMGASNVVKIGKAEYEVLPLI